MRKPGVLESQFPEGLLLYDPETGKTLLLNETAALVWRMADREPEEIARALAEEYEVDEAQALQDAEETLSLLREEGFLR